MSEDVGQISDGYHTFGELYDHRSILFIALMQSNPDISWVADLHEDGSMFPGFFIAGMELPDGQITYHLKRHPWFKCLVQGRANIKYITYAPPYDGHTPEDVIERLEKWVHG